MHHEQIVRKIPRPVLAALALFGLSACTTPVPLAPGCRPWAGSGSTTDPPTHCLFFPSGLELDPLGDILYVTNTNADLSFGGGTLAAIDVVRFDNAVEDFRRNGNGQVCTGTTCTTDPRKCPGYALGPNASVEETEAAEKQALGITGDDQQQLASFDHCYCQRDILDEGIVNCESQRFVLRDQTVKTGNFSGQVRLLAEDPMDLNALTQKDWLHRALYLPVRGDPSLTVMDVYRHPRVSLKTAAPPVLTIDCKDSGKDPGATPRVAGDLITKCDDNHRIQFSEDQDPNDPTMPRLTVPPEPFGLVFDKWRDLRGVDHHYLVMTHLSGGDLSVFDLRLPGSRIASLTDVAHGLFPADTAGRTGAFAVAPRVPGDLNQAWYATSRLSGRIATFRLSVSAPDAVPPGPTVVPGLFASVSGDYASSNQDVRDLIFEPGGQRAFLSVSSPPSLAVLDTRPDPGSDPPGVPANQLVSITDECLEPSWMALGRIPYLARGDNKLSVANRLYMACYLAGQLAVVDPDGGSLLDLIQVGRGPLTVVLNFGGERDGGHVNPCADPYVKDDAEAKARGWTCPQGGGLRQQRPRAYVTSYLDNSIAVIDLYPFSPTYNRVVSRIGIPSPKQVQ